MNGQLCQPQPLFTKLLKWRASIDEGWINTSCLYGKFNMLVIIGVAQMFLPRDSHIFAHMQSFVQQVHWVVTTKGVLHII